MVHSGRVDAHVSLVAAPVMVNHMVLGYPLPGAKRLKEEARPAARLFGRVVAEAAIHFRARGKA